MRIVALEPIFLINEACVVRTLNGCTVRIYMRGNKVKKIQSNFICVSKLKKKRKKPHQHTHVAFDLCELILCVAAAAVAASDHFSIFFRIKCSYGFG